jgi:hypothetical protein
MPGKRYRAVRKRDRKGADPPEATQAILTCLALPARAQPLRAARIDDASEEAPAPRPSTAMPRSLPIRSSFRTLLRGMSATPSPASTSRFCAVRLSTGVKRARPRNRPRAHGAAPVDRRATKSAPYVEARRPASAHASRSSSR